MKVKVYMELDVEDTSPIFSSTPEYHMEDLMEEIMDLLYENNDITVVECTVERE